MEILSMPGHLIRRLQQIAVAVFMDRASEAGYDITPVQYGALDAIVARPGLDQATLAGLIAYDKVTIGGVIDRLEQKGYLTRRVNARDRRARELHLTDEGKRVHEAMTPIVRRIQSEILGGLTEQEQTTLLALLKKATDAGNRMSRMSTAEQKQARAVQG